MTKIKIEGLSSEELIEQLEKVFGSRRILAEEGKLDYQSIGFWKTNGIPKSGTTRPYLELLLYTKINETKKEEELERYRTFFNQLKQLTEQ